MGKRAFYKQHKRNWIVAEIPFVLYKIGKIY